VVSLSSFCLRVCFEETACFVTIPEFVFAPNGPDVVLLPDPKFFPATDESESKRDRVVELLTKRDLKLAVVGPVEVTEADVAILVGAGDVLSERMEEDEMDFAGTFFKSSVLLAPIAGVETFFANVDAVGLTEGITGAFSRGPRGERVVVLGDAGIIG